MLPMPDVVELISVTRRFLGSGEPVTAVDRLNLAVRGGEFFSLLGASGCGKTTVLRLVAGFERPDAGEVRIKGQPATALPPYARPVNTVFQSYALFEHLNVFENVAFGLQMEKLPRPEIRARVAEVLALVRLTGLEGRKPRALSGGQNQRVALARALVKRPAVLLLDEPLSALDLQLRRQMQGELKQIQRQMGMTFIFVTHDQEEALAMSDRIGVMAAGRLLQVGSPVDIYERPACRFVAEFVGETNSLSGIVRARDADGIAVDVPGLGLLHSGHSHDLRVGQAVVACIRPEKWRLDEVRGSNCFEGASVDSTFTGALTRHLIEVGGGLRLTVLSHNRGAALATDGRVQVAVDPADVQVFSEETP
jgi:spermidine/putrescine transport system ATP-binding protein